MAMNAALIVAIVLTVTSLLLLVLSVALVRHFRPALWGKLQSSVMSWIGADVDEELRTLTPLTVSTPTCATPVQIISTSVNDECQMIDVQMPEDASTPISDGGSLTDSTDQIVTASKRLTAAAFAFLHTSSKEGATHSGLVSQRSFGPFLTLDDAVDPDVRLPRAYSCNLNQRRTSSPNVKESLEVELLSFPLSQASSAESFVSDSATSELEADIRSHKNTLEFQLDYSEESSTLSFFRLCVNGIVDMTAAYSMTLTLGPQNKSLATEYVRGSGAGTITFDGDMKFKNIQGVDFDKHEVIVRLLKKSSGMRSVTLCAYTQFQLDFLFLLRSASLKFALEDAGTFQNAAGELIVSLSFLPTAQRITTISLKARNLKTTSDVMVKSYLIENGKIASRKRTSMKKGCDLVTWSEVIYFRPEGNVEKCRLRYIVTEASEKDPSKSTVIGSVSIGPDCLGTGFIHWHQMINSPRKSITMCHRLKS